MTPEQIVAVAFLGVFLLITTVAMAAGLYKAARGPRPCPHHEVRATGRWACALVDHPRWPDRHYMQRRA